MEKKLDYPEEFIERVVSTYPDNEVLHRLLKRGAGKDVGKYLKKLIPKGISAKKVLAASSLSELQEEAVRIIKKERIFEEWKKIRNKANP